VRSSSDKRREQKGSAKYPDFFLDSTHPHTAPIVMTARAIVNARAVNRWAHGHPWIYRSDVDQRPDVPAGVVEVADGRGRRLGVALWSPASEISLRLLERNPDVIIDASWWKNRIHDAAARRSDIAAGTNAYRIVHGEADGCPSLICDRYDRYIVVQLMSAGVEAHRDFIVQALEGLPGVDGILARNDVALRRKERLPVGVELLRGSVPEQVEVNEHGIRYLAAPWTGQKTGAFLDQRENRVLIGANTMGRALDCFSYHGSFALHMAPNADRVLALDASAAALERARANAALNGFTNVETRETDAFEFLKSAERSGEKYDTIVLDPPAFAKTKSALPAAIRGYKEINLRAMRMLAPNGILLSASCSFHLSKALFLDMLRDAAGDSGRRMILRELRGQPADHPEILTIPETGYIKSALLQAAD
jgi:23S rRNA (cytosine1962-C5)-methyltransferase